MDSNVPKGTGGRGGTMPAGLDDLNRFGGGGGGGGSTPVLGIEISSFRRDKGEGEGRGGGGGAWSIV